MLEVRIDYATHSKVHPRTSKKLDFVDHKHLENFLAKAAREGKKIIGHEILNEPCVYYLDPELWTYGGYPPPNFFREMGVKFKIIDFQNAFNKPHEFGGVNQETGYIMFDNIKNP